MLPAFHEGRENANSFSVDYNPGCWQLVDCKLFFWGVLEANRSPAEEECILGIPVLEGIAKDGDVVCGTGSRLER